jgi:tetratricopeptide (TPR) repeat protein
MASKVKERSPACEGSSSPSLFIALAVAALTFLVFLPALQNGFLNWDDQANFLDNVHYRGLGWTQLSWMLTTFHGGPYQPLSWLSFGADYLLWGMSAAGYHLTNVLIHCVNASLFCLLTRRLLRLAWRQEPAAEPALSLCAAFSALLFSVHPLRVESVAWVTERRDVLSGAFFLLCLICYVKAHSGALAETRRRSLLRAALGLYACSLLSKAIAVGLPLLLLALDFYPLRRLQDAAGAWSRPRLRSALQEKIPFILLAAAAAITALLAQAQAEALVSWGRYGLGPRLLQAVYGAGFYLGKTLVPCRLSPLYALSAPLRQSWRPYLLCGGTAAGLSLAALWWRRRWPALLTAWLSYLVLLAPVSGLAQAGDQYVADRYSYLSCLSWAALAGGGLMLCWRARREQRLGLRSWRLLVLAAVLSLAGLAQAAWRQTGIWHDSQRLWQRVLALDGDIAVAHYNLGTCLAEQGRLGEAVEHFQRAEALRPQAIEVYNNLAIAYWKLGESESALRCYDEALRIQPDSALTHANLGAALVHLKRLPQAEAQYRQALRLRPDSSAYYDMLGMVLTAQGRWPESIEPFTQAVRLNPRDADAHYRLALALGRSGRTQQSAQELEETLRLKPDHAAANSLGNLLGGGRLRQ